MAPATRKPRQFKPRQCEGCDGMFTPTNGRQIYCPTCLADPEFRRQRQLSYNRRNYSIRKGQTRVTRLPARPPAGPDAYKIIRRDLGYSTVDSLLAMSQGNDPFYCGTGGDRQLADWFADIWHRYNLHGAHLRRVHYLIYSRQERDHQGHRYQNTENSWAHLCHAARAARYLGKVDPEAVADQRNAEAKINVLAEGWRIPEPLLPTADWDLPDFELPEPDFELPEPVVDGYEYSPADQPTLLEVWIEKSTMDDVLVPLCQELHVNFLSGTGYESITRIVELLRRAEAAGKPVHVFYISDYDPHGRNMPLQVSRQSEFWADQFGDVPRITVESLALTAEQVAQFDLPVDFSRHERGAVELDALEAYAEGELARVIRQAVARWRDSRLRERLRTAERAAGHQAGAQWAAANIDLAGRLAGLNREAEAVIERHRPAIEAVNADLAEVRARLAQLEADAQARFDETDFDVPDRPEASDPEVDTDEMLYDSDRPWDEQLEYYHRHRTGEAA